MTTHKSTYYSLPPCNYTVYNIPVTVLQIKAAKNCRAEISECGRGGSIFASSEVPALFHTSSTNNIYPAILAGPLRDTHCLEGRDSNFDADFTIR